MLRIGCAGTGLIAWAHGLGLAAMIDAGVIDAEISVVFDRSEKRAQGFAAMVGATVVRDLDELVERCDAIWVCTPTSAHREAVDVAVQAGRAIFCEKPLATDLAGAADLTATVAAAGVPAQSGLVLRSAPVFRALRDLVASGRLGRPMTTVFRDDQYFPIQGTYASQWRGDVTQAGGGCLIEHSIHDLDILRYCFGEVQEVSGRTSNFAGHEGIEDLAVVSLSFAGGLEATLTSVWHNILSRGSTRRIEVFCEDGMVWLDDEFRGPLHMQTSEQTTEMPCPSPDWVDALPLGDDDVGLAVKAYVEADRAFVDAVAAGTAPEPSLDVALVAHRLVDAAYRSADGGGVPVSLG
ncbi:MAG TPA: Gfo/Idh/MocA family oxidoreductase [Acidimicrobiales bacterium]|jgi:predicted dehydrogenase|nr:Gfo/Idh/MocA family oxidoreductase [Acidimicrobiales bacterium]